MAHAQLTGATEQIQTEDAKLWLGLDPKLSSTNVACNQLMETLKHPTCQPQQERTWEAAFPEGKRVKRLIKKTQKAIDGAESEQLFLSQSKKRKALTLPLSAKPTRLIVKVPLLENYEAEMATDSVEGKENKVPDNRKQESRMAMINEAREREERGKEGEKMQRSKLIVRIPLYEKRGAQMATDGVEGKENKLPDKCKQESRMAMRTKAREREERGKEGEKMQRSNLVWNQVPEVDITPNYFILPVENTEPPSTNQTDLERSVLNETVRLVRRHTGYHRELNHHEKVLLHNEDIRFELDMLLEIVQATIKQVEMWINDINCGSGKPMESYFSAGNRRCIENLYGHQGIEMVRMLQERPDEALHIILARLREKSEEVINYHTDFNHVLYSQASSVAGGTQQCPAVGDLFSEGPLNPYADDP